MSDSNKPVKLVSQEEQDKISRNVLIWLNTCPEIPKDVDLIRYETLEDDTTCMALSTIQGAFIVQRYIHGGYQAEYQFKLIYRVKPGDSMDRRLKSDERLDRISAWANDNKKDLRIGDALHVLNIEPATRSSLFAMYENGDEDHQILMKLNYEVI